MAINATSSATVRELIPAGNYVARCYQMIEIGTVAEIVMGKSSTLHKVRIGWELPEELRVFDDKKGEQPLVISTESTLSMHEKSNLRKELKSWRGKDFTEEEAKCFDITKLLGVPCMLNIIHKPGVSDPSKIYERIAGITPLPKTLKAPAAILPIFCLSYDNFDFDLFEKLPDFIKIKMRASLEFAALTQPKLSHVDAAAITEPIDDLPF
jgi:hypothetical protein